MVGVHLHPAGSTTCAALRREAKVPQHSARGAGWDLCGEVRDVTLHNRASVRQGCLVHGDEKQSPTLFMLYTLFTRLEMTLDNKTLSYDKIPIVHE